MFTNVKTDPMVWIKDKLLGRLIDEVWQEGYNAGISNARREMRNRLKREFAEKGLENFSSKELQIGYNYAKGITEDVVEGKI